MNTKIEKSNGHECLELSTNLVVSPAYWGSLTAFLLTMTGTMVISIVKGPPDPILKTPAFVQGHLLAYIACVVMVSSYVIRYYSALTLSNFGVSEASLKNSPRNFRKVLFFLLSTIILLAGLNTFVLRAIGVVPALSICVFQSVLALVSFGGVWVGKQFRPELFNKIRSPFSFGEIFFLLVCSFLLYILHTAPEDGNQGISMFIGASIGWTIWFTAHEWLHRYALGVKRQFKTLWESLDS